MNEVHTMRDLEYLEEQNRQLRESLKACKLEVNKYAVVMDEAADEIERLRAALLKAADDLDSWGGYVAANNARAELAEKSND